MNKLLNKIDIFGTVFTFTTFNRPKFTSAVGGFFTLITVGMMLTLIIIFGRPVYMKLNPNVIVQEKDLPTYPFYNLTMEKFPFAFRYENEARIPTPNVDKYIFPFIQLNQQKKDPETGIYKTYKVHVLKSAPCTMELLNNPELVEVLDGYTCIDWRGTNYTLGGLWDNGNDLVDYFKITLFMCNFDGNSYTNCTDYDAMNSILNAKVKQYLSIMIPDVSITSTDPVSPMKVVTTNYFFTLSPLMMRTDRFYYRGLYVDQDTGWFFEGYNHYDGFTLERRDTDIQMRTVEDYNNMSTIRTIATVVVMAGKKIVTYQVNFQKVQYVIANLGGILQIFFTGFTFLQAYINSHLSYFYIANKVFDYEEKDTISKIATRYRFSQMIDPNEKSVNNSSSNLASHNINHVSQFKPNLGRTNLNSNSEDFNIVRNPEKSKSTKRLSKLIQYTNTQKSKVGRLKIPLKIIVKKIFFCNDKEDYKSKLYFHSEDIVKGRLDIIYYLRFINKMDNFMRLFLSKEQAECLKFINNEKINEDRVKSKTNEVYLPLEQDDHLEEVKSVYRYFSRRKANNEMSSIDEKILNMLDERL